MDSVLVAGASTAKDQHTNMLTPSDAVQQQHSTLPLNRPGKGFLKRPRQWADDLIGTLDHTDGSGAACIG